MNRNEQNHLVAHEQDEITNRFLADYPVHCELRTAPLEQKRLHSHDGFEFYLLLQGSGTYIVGDRLYPLHAGTLTVIRPRAIHRPYSADGQAFHRYVLSINEAYLSGLDAVCSSMQYGIGSLLTEEGLDGCQLFLSVQQLSRVQTLMAELNIQLRTKPALYALSVLNAVTELLLLIIRLRTRPENAVSVQQSDKARLIGDILSHLVTHYQEELRIDDLLQQFPVSRSRLLSLFKETTGHTINQFLTDYRLNKAKALLAGTDLPITEVALRTGFGDLSHFFNIFKRQAGSTPKQYRAESARTPKGSPLLDGPPDFNS